jgi:hypothetical protein
MDELPLLPVQTLAQIFGGIPHHHWRGSPVRGYNLATRKNKTTASDSAHFSGHETFPLRQMWLKKAFDRAEPDGIVLKSTFSNDNAIAEFGVGKNMVAAIRHWALACDVLRDDAPQGYSLSPTAVAIFSDGGLDPYSENPSTAWYAHWWLAGRGNRATNMVATFILSGQFIGFLPDHYAENFVRSGRMRPMKPGLIRYACTYSGITRRSPAPSRTTQLFIECLKHVHSSQTYIT